MTHPDSTDDDALAEAIADAWVARAAAEPELRRMALYAAGLEKQPADMSARELASKLGVSERSLRRTASDALFKLRHHPAALAALRCLKNDL
jgi:DNA-directed RNA polymerase specialized sigma24 family protein